MINKIIIKIETVDDFFNRGRQLARALDNGDKIQSETIISFEDPSDMMKLITDVRLDLFRAIKSQPGLSITQISEHLHRDRSAVKRDIDIMERAGLVQVAEKAFPGHGRLKEVRVTADKLKLQLEVA